MTHTLTNRNRLVDASFALAILLMFVALAAFIVSS